MLPGGKFGIRELWEGSGCTLPLLLGGQKLPGQPQPLAIFARKEQSQRCADPATPLWAVLLAALAGLCSLTALISASSPRRRKSRWELSRNSFSQVSKSGCGEGFVFIYSLRCSYGLPGVTVNSEPFP